MQKFFIPQPISLEGTIAIVRMIVGLLLIYHGLEVFNPEIMNDYMQWDQFKGSMGDLKVYAGKSAELLAGILLLLGLLTRVGALLVIGTFLFITFFVGQGRFWYEEQHPFMFALFGVLFLFVGPGAWSLDTVVFEKKEKPRGGGSDRYL